MAINAAFFGQGQLSRPALEVGMFLCVAAIAGSWKVKLVPMGPLERMSSMSLGSALTFAGMLRLGPAYGMLIGCVATLSACVQPLQKWHQLTFNVSLTAISAASFGKTVDLLTNHPAGQIQASSFPAVAFASLIYWLVNTGGVAVVISLMGKESVFTVWKKSFIWTAPGYFTGASISMLLSIVTFQFPTGSRRNERTKFHRKFPVIHFFNQPATPSIYSHINSMHPDRGHL